MTTRAESPLTELDAALDRLGQLERELWNRTLSNDLSYYRNPAGYRPKPTRELKQQIARQREIVRRIARGEQ